MSTQLGEAFVPIRATLDKLDGDLASAKSKMEGALSKVTKNLQTIGKTAMAATAGGILAMTAGVVAIGKQAIPAASDLNEALNASSVVFEDAAGVIQDFGRIASDTAGLSAREFNQMAAETGSMLLNFGFSADQAAQDTVDLTQRAADMASIFNTDVGDALGAIQSGLQGQSLPLRRFGVDMSDSAIKAKALEMGLGDITRQSDSAGYAQASLALLMEQTDRIAGDFVNTSGDLANATRINQARWENFMAQVGKAGLPIMTTVQSILMNVGEKVFPIVTAAIETALPIVEGISEAISTFAGNLLDGESPLEAVKTLIYDLGEALGINKETLDGVAEGFQNVVDFIQQVIDTVSPYLEMAWQWISQNIELQDVLIALGIAIAAVVLPAILSIVAAAAPVIATAIALIATIALVRTAWENDWGGIRTAITDWWQKTGKPILDQLREWLAVNIPRAIETLKQFWTNTLLPAIQAVWAWISGTLIPYFKDTVVPWIQEKITNALQVLAEFWKTVLWPAIQDVYNWISGTLIPFFRDTVVPWLQEKITTALQTLSDFWTNTLLPAIQAVWDFIQDPLIPLFEALVSFFDAAFTLALTALAGLWENVLQPALKAVGDYVSEKLQPILEALQRFWTNVFGPKIEGVKTSVLDKLPGVFEGIKKAIGWVIEKLERMTEWLNKIELPAWLTPGSPTPFEIGLKGISKAMEEMNRLTISPKFDMDALLPVMALAGAEDTEGAPRQVNYNSTTTIHTNRDPMRVLRASRHLDRLGSLS